MTLYNHYKTENDVKETFNKDPETEAMKIFVDKIDRLKEEGTEITTKHLKNALMAVLRASENIYNDGETTSSAGSDQAPSEDNLEPEEILKVVPIDDDDLDKKGKKKKEPQVQDLGTSISPNRRRMTQNE